MTEFDEKNESSFPSREPFDEESIVTGARTPVPLSLSSLSQKDAPTNSVYPDGGLQANMTVLGAFVALFCTFGQMNAFGTFQAWYASHQLAAMNPSTISWIGSLQLWIFFFSVSRHCHIPCLILAECPTRVGIRCRSSFWRVRTQMVNERWNGLLPCQYHANKHVCALLSIRSGSGRAFWSRSWLTVNRSFHFILSGTPINQFPGSPSFYPSLSSVSTHFSKYRATALGIASAGSSFGLPFFLFLLPLILN